MSWLFSQALVVEYSDRISWDGIQSAQLSVMPTQHKFWRNDKTMEFSRLSQFGLTCAVLTEGLGEELLTLYLADFHAKTLAQQEKAQVSTVLDQVCGPKWLELLVKYDLDLCSWRTHQCLFLMRSALRSDEALLHEKQLLVLVYRSVEPQVTHAVP